MIKSRWIAITVSALVIASLVACGAAGAPTTAGGAGQQATSQLETQVVDSLAATGVAQTAIANAVAGTQTAIASVPAATLTAMPTNTPQLASTATLAPTTAPALPSGVPTVTASESTNCRSGPSTEYTLLGILYVGQSAQVVGRSTLPNYLIITLPPRQTVTCWLWTQNTNVSGDIASLPLISVPPLPSPAPTAVTGFSVAYLSTIKCGSQYRFKFRIVNTGGLTWESNSVKAADQVTSETRSASYDDFQNWNSSCSETNADSSLAPGDNGTTISAAFTNNPAGHTIKASIHVCSLNGMDGTCLQENITFTG